MKITGNDLEQLVREREDLESAAAQAMANGDRAAFGEHMQEYFRVSAEIGVLGRELAREQQLYGEALDADAHFQANLERQFGSAAGNRRYDSSQAGWDADTRAAAERKMAADAAWRKALAALA